MASEMMGEQPRAVRDPLFAIEGKKAIITGASRGIGRAIAEGLATRGVEVCCMARNQSRLDETLKTIRDRGGTATSVVVDLADDQQLDRAFAEALESLGGLDILVNNAGIDHLTPALEMSLDAWDQVMRVNLRAVFRMAQLAGRVMVRQESGKVINIGSIGSHVAYHHDSAYIAAKHGLLGLTRALALEWAKANVQVNMLAPGYHRTDMTLDAYEDQRGFDWVVKRTPARRWGEMNDLLGAVVLLASPASDFMTGTSITIDGGFTVQ
jgi:NAD(P)-dependent dehydrogenase (short-subunit alcohol dehydrogenase family)